MNWSDPAMSEFAKVHLKHANIGDSGRSLLHDRTDAFNIPQQFKAKGTLAMIILVRSGGMA